MISFSSPESKIDAVPLQASTIILVRDDDAALQVQLLQRQKKSSFAPSAWVFAGGQVDKDDAALASFWDASSLSHLSLENTQSPTESLLDEELDAMVGSVFRELFEEACVILSSEVEGTSPALCILRQSLLKGEHDFTELLTRLKLRLDPNAIHYFSHWITPSAERRRFDARIFIARMPEGQHGQVDASEVTRLKWISPQDAISKVASGEMLMVPPTLRSLEYISQFQNADELFSAVAGLRPFPILPKVVIEDELRTIVLPWDEAYESLEGEGLAVPEGVEPFGSSRIGERDGGWCSF